MISARAIIRLLQCDLQKSYKTLNTAPAVMICATVIVTERACKSLNFFRLPSSAAAFIAGIKICRVGRIEKKYS